MDGSIDNSMHIFFILQGLFRHNDLSGPGQGFGGPVDGVIGIKGKVAGPVGLDEVIQVGGPIVLDGHGREGRGHVGIGGLRCFDSGQGT